MSQLVFPFYDIHMTDVFAIYREKASGLEQNLGLSEAHSKPSAPPK